ncbi:MAG: hypothetical protein FJ225_03400 [Lentisphaerae bacterium]|nr:hypothetical protein [Lentisphaerota bacterium]
MLPIDRGLTLAGIIALSLRPAPALPGTNAPPDDRAAVLAGREYILRSFDPDKHGVPKRYDPLTDDSGSRLHTTYTASAILTLLKSQDLFPDPRVPEQTRRALGFLLAMQVSDAESRCRGAFHYSYDLATQSKEERFVSGTASKAIFTLLALAARDAGGDAADPRLMPAATAAADWLIGMIRSDGSVIPHLEFEDGEWSRSTKRSFLYSGQALSALSRVYAATRDPKYRVAASRIARHMRSSVAAGGFHLGDDYRAPNPISSSWVLLSLLDFGRATGEKWASDLALDGARDLLPRQARDPSDALNHGRWSGAFSTSGTGWIAEVLVEALALMRQREAPEAEDCRRAIADGMQWVLSHAYTADNSSHLPNPRRAMGGLKWNNANPWIRIDAVCHSLNALIGVCASE